MTSDALQRFSDGVVRLRPLDVADAEAQVAGGTLVGVVGIQSGMAYLAVGQVNITYGRYPHWRGRGLATKGVRLGIDLVLELFRPTELVIRVDRANAASTAVAGRLGFAFSHHTAEHDDGEGELDWYVLKG